MEVLQRVGFRIKDGFRGRDRPRETKVTNSLTLKPFALWVAIYPQDKVIPSLNNRGLFSGGKILKELINDR